MAEIAFSQLASIDLAETYVFGAENFGTDAALDYHRGLQAAVDRLSAFPQIGPIYPGLRPATRFLAFRRHHIFYDFDGEKILVIRIVHHSKDVRGLF